MTKSSEHYVQTGHGEMARGREEIGQEHPFNSIRIEECERRPMDTVEAKRKETNQRVHQQGCMKESSRNERRASAIIDKL